jgi:hypothetical protein
MFITAALCLAVLMLAAEKHSSTPFAPVCVVSFLSRNEYPVLPNLRTDGETDRCGFDAIRLSSVSRLCRACSVRLEETFESRFFGLS